MRPIERKILNKIDEKGMSPDQILEILDQTSKQEMKKSFPDDCHFQSDRYFARIIIDSLLRIKAIKKEGNRFFRTDLKKKKTDSD